ncbi:hypothetical protein [Trichloromonas sp.]|uniref:hypothetical protein n=1 Tax=Trichloromonas sp. TaxID=3069249 RepID=UPI002A38709C|nr:hypothetical protein [Trichloromonas sp.]
MNLAGMIVETVKAFCAESPANSLTGDGGEAVWGLPLVGAIDERGYDKVKCHAYIREVTAIHARTLLGAEVTPCGLCQVGIPCEERIPPGVAGV